MGAHHLGTGAAADDARKKFGKDYTQMFRT